MCVTFVWSFGVFTVDPGQSVKPMGVCVYTSNREHERERDESKEVRVKERQPEESKCFDK